ncbi:MAG: hypothetical protein ABSB82_06385 [Terriglobia bacterium]
MFSTGGDQDRILVPPVLFSPPFPELVSSRRIHPKHSGAGSVPKFKGESQEGSSRHLRRDGIAAGHIVCGRRAGFPSINRNPASDATTNAVVTHTVE